MPTTRPYGTWPSPITTALITGHKIALSQPRFVGDELLWHEMRPKEGGRGVVVRAARGAPVDVTPAGWDVNTRVHEYGGGDFTPFRDDVYFVNDQDQRLYRQRGGGAPGPLTPPRHAPRALRYADPLVTRDGRWVVCVRERHEGPDDVVNDLVAVPADGGPPRVLHVGCDFYASPSLSPDGERLAFLTWNHPQMPWDGTQAWVAHLRSGELRDPICVAGGADVSVFQPAWSPEGVLHLVSDATGWWNLYALEGGQLRPLAPRAAEFGVPQWVFGLSTYAFLSRGRIACVRSENGRETLAILQPGSTALEDVPLPFTSYGSSLTSDGSDRLAFVGGGADRASSLYRYDVSVGRLTEVRPSFEAPLDRRFLSVPEPITFPTTGGLEAHALFYAPTNGEAHAPSNERPPLLVQCHGGPTSQCTSSLGLSTQFWASRGFAVVDVNYGGSSGYGRAYRNRLRHAWGVVDRDECVHVARHLAARGVVDGDRMSIRGGSAGGYTALLALVSSDVFAAGCSLYGIANLEALARHTHKFERRYLDGLVGPYPERKDLYEARSPLRDLDRLSCPVILLQGREDRVVPPEQSDQLAAALDAKRLPYAYVVYEGEGHGFRRAETIAAALEAELAFYGRVFGFEPADSLPPLDVRHLETWVRARKR